jgi:hypothetical protein
MRYPLLHATGILATLLYAAFVVWVYATQPRTLKDVTQGARVAAGAYKVDPVRFDTALSLFHRGLYRAARDEWERADPARADARTQFYIAYAFYREGWGRLYHDDALYTQGQQAADRALALTPSGTLIVDDPDLKIHTPAELRAELEKGREKTWSDLNPMKVLEERK